MITLWKDDIHWVELLRQEGVCFHTGSRIGGRTVVILNEEPGALHAQRIWQHIESGGGLLAPGINAAGVWLEFTPENRRLRWIAPEGESALFRNVGIVDTDTAGTILSGANVGTADSGDMAIRTAPVGRGFCIILPFRVLDVLSTVAYGPKQFYARTPRLPYDTVARASRGEVRRLVGNCLRALLAHRGLPYVHLATHPGRTSSVFAFRVDTDFGPRRDLEAVARLAERVGMKFSWFVNVGKHRAHLDLFADLARQGHDIQLHCMRHTVYPDHEHNLDNFRAAKEAMADAGLKPCGVVAPFGEWNPNLNRAFEELGFEYSSEFCLAYDDLPFRPVVESESRRVKHRSDQTPHASLLAPRLSRVLQVPVHPICLGRLVAARADEKQMAAYFRSVIDLQVARREPCILYDHPERIAQFSDLLAEVLHYAKERCGATTTMTQFARWWQRRERLHWSASVSENVLEATVNTEDSDVPIVVEQGERFATLPAASGKHDLAGLKWHALPEPIPFDRKQLTTRKPSLLLHARSLRRRAQKNLQGHRG
ncbi:MAG TPA: polysaccharide deacetylase family protein [bacterium]|nr:polysaccharide deacetylase family protein [bacterium]